MEERKEIILTGDAAVPSGGKRKRTRKNQKGGGSGQGGTIVQLQSTASSSEGSNVIGTNTSKLALSAQPVEPQQQKGGKPKIILKAATKPLNKVILSVSKIPALKVAESQPKNKTRKSSKKIMFSLKNFI